MPGLLKIVAPLFSVQPTQLCKPVWLLNILYFVDLYYLLFECRNVNVLLTIVPSAPKPYLVHNLYSLKGYYLKMTKTQKFLIAKTPGISNQQ